MSHHCQPHPLRRSTVALVLSWLALGASAAGTVPGAPSAPDPATVQFLVASSAKDFKAQGADRPSAIRKARVGYFAESGKGVYLLCGDFKAGAGPQAKWTSFATIKTSDYEQWLGGTAQAFCGQRSIQWYAPDHSAALLQAIRE